MQQEEPTRTEIDALASKLYHSIYPRSNYHQITHPSVIRDGLRKLSRDILMNECDFLQAPEDEVQP